MLKKIERDQNNKCSSLYKLTNNIIFTIDNNTYINGVSFNSYMSILNFSVFENQLYFYEKNILYKIEKKQLIELFSNKDADKISVATRDMLLSSKRISRNEMEYSFYDINYKLLSQLSINGYIKLFDNFFIITPKFDIDSIAFYKFDNFNKPLWHFTLPKGFTIYNPIQVVDGVMFFYATKGGNDFMDVYGLDIKTGKVLWEQHFKVPYTQNNIASLINPKNNLCYGYGTNLYQVFNPVTGKMVFEKDMSEHYKQGIDPFLSRNFIHDNMLYFVSGRDERAKFGALNIDTAEIEFVQDYPFKKGGQFYQIIYHNQKLYLLDSNKTLHIFEDL